MLGLSRKSIYARDSIISSPLKKLFLAVTTYIVLFGILYSYRIANGFSLLYGFGYYNSSLLFPLPWGYVVFLLEFVMVIHVLFTLLVKNDKRTYHNIALLELIAIASINYFYVARPSVSIMDSYNVLVDALRIWRGDYQLTRHSPLASFLIMPFLILFNWDLIGALIGIYFYYICTILVGYDLWKRFSLYIRGREDTFPLLPLVLVLSPTIFVLAKVINYEIFLLLFSMIMIRHLLVFFYDRPQDRDYFIFIASEFAIVLLKISYLVVFVLTTNIFLVLVLFYRYYESSRRSHAYAASLISIASAVEVILGALLTQHVLKSSINIKFIFNITYISETWGMSLYITLVVINSVASRKYFSFMFYDLQKFSLPTLIISVLLLIFTFFESTRGRRFYLFATYTSVIGIAHILFFGSYVGIQGRYFIIIYLLMAMIVSLGVRHLYEISIEFPIRLRTIYKLAIQIAVLVLLLFSFTNTALVAYNWGEYSVAVDNYSLFSQDDVQSIFGYLSRYKRVVVFTSLSSMVYYYSEIYRLNVVVFSVWDFFHARGIDHKSVSELLYIIGQYLDSGFRVFYLAGWPELDGFRPFDSVYDFSYVIIAINSSFSYRVLLVGRYQPRASQRLVNPVYALGVIGYRDADVTFR